MSIKSDKKRVEKIITNVKHRLKRVMSESIRDLIVRVRLSLTVAEFHYFTQCINAEKKEKFPRAFAKLLAEKSQDPDFEAILGKIRSDPQSVELVLKASKVSAEWDSLNKLANLG